MTENSNLNKGKLTTEILKADFGNIEIYLGDLVIRKSIKSFGAYQKTDLAMLLSAIEINDNVLDLGAHVGSFTIPISKQLQANNTVASIEGDPRTFSILKNNIKRNELVNVRPHNVLLSDVSGSLFSSDRNVENNYNSGGNTWIEAQTDDGSEITQKSITLHDFLLENYPNTTFNVIKSDIEGYDISVLLNSKSLIIKNRPLLMFEVQMLIDGNKILEIEQFLIQENYAFFVNVAPNNTDIFSYIPYRISNISEVNDGFRFDVFCVPKEQKKVTEWDKYTSDVESSNFSQAAFQFYFKKNVANCVDILSTENNKELKINYLKALSYFGLNNFEEAKNSINDCINQGHNQAELFFLLSKIQFKCGKFDQAKISIEIALSKTSFRANYFFHLAKVLIQFKDFRGAIESLEKGIQMSSNNLRAYKMLIRCSREFDDEKRTRKFCEKAIKEYNHDADLRILIGNFYLKNNKPELAKQQYKAAVELCPENVEYLQKLKAIDEKAIHIFDSKVKVFRHQLVDTKRRGFKPDVAFDLEKELLFKNKIETVKLKGNIINTGDTFGYYSLLTKHLRTDISIHCMQPSQLHLKYFKQNIHLNDFQESDFNIHQASLGMRTGKIDLEESKSKDQLAKTEFDKLDKSLNKETMRVYSINYFIKNHCATIDLINIDLKGSAFEVLKGGSKSFKENKIKSLMISTHSENTHLACIDFLKKYKFLIERDISKESRKNEGMIIATNPSF